jgi:hypothetical protein
MSLESNSIKSMISIIKNIHHDFNTNPKKFTKEKILYISALEDKHPDLVQSYSSIFNMFKQEDINNEKINRLHYMLQMALKVKKGSLESKDANVKVGQVLVDKIVIPQVKRVRKENNKK